MDCNRHMIGGTLRLKPSPVGAMIPGAELSEPASTMMAARQHKIKQFIAANLGDAAMQRYNSRLPIVVYARKTRRLNTASGKPKIP